MSKIVMIAEKTSMITEYKNALKNVPNLIVCSAIGHIDDILPLESFLGFEGKVGWSVLLSKLPYKPPKFTYIIKDKYTELFDRIYDACVTADEIVLACDSGREGELIHRRILEQMSLKNPAIMSKKITRIWLDENTEDMIREAFQNRKDYKYYEGLYQSAELRSRIDWLIGVQSTVALTVLLNAPRGEVYSSGRLQTYGMKLIVDRHNEILNFKPEDYWNLHYYLKDVDGKDVVFDYHQKQIKDYSFIESLLKKLSNFPLVITKNETKSRLEYPHKLFNLASLTVEANRRYKMTGKKVLECAQSLYFTKKVLTYPRVDCDVVPPDTAKKFINILHLVELSGFDPKIVSTVKATNSDCVLSEKFIGPQKDHAAITPVFSYNKNDPFPILTPDERKIFDLVCERTLLTLLPPSKIEEMFIEGTINGELFKKTFQRYIDKGWAEYAHEKSNPIGFCSLKFEVGAHYNGELKTHKDVTKCPKYLTEADIQIRLCGAHKEVESSELREFLKDAEGIGTAATRNDLCETLLSRKYVIYDQQYIKPTELGLMVYEVSSSLLKKADYSARLEQILAAIAHGSQEYSLEKEVDNSYFLLQNALTEIRNNISSIDIKTREKISGVSYICDCPHKCGGRVYLKTFGKQGGVYLCTNNTGRNDENPPLCSFSIQLEICKKKITEKDILALCSGKETALIKGMISQKIDPKTGKNYTFSCRLKYNLDTKKLDFLYDK